MAYLDDHPPARRQFYCPRRDGTLPSGVVVVHTAENTPDWVAFDGGAEAVASFIQGRDTPGSYHDLADSDSIIQLVGYECEAFHDATGTNRHSYGVSGATRADVWPLAPKAWRDGCVRNMAAAARRYANWLTARRGIVIPPRRITVAQARAQVPGFISHAELDPTRRSDPGAQFPWDQFFAQFQGEDDMTPAECEAVVRKVLGDKSTGLRAEIGRLGQKLMLGAGNLAYPPDIYGNAVTLPSVMVAVLADRPDLDESAVAAEVLKILTPEAIAAAIPDELADQVADELAARLAG